MPFRSGAGARSANLRSIFYVLLASASFCANDISTKLAVTKLPAPEILVIRGTIAAVLALTLICLVHGAAQLKKLMQPHVLYRGLLEALIGPLLITCLALLPLSTVSAVTQICPFLAMIAGIYLFRETVGWRRWCAAFVGFFGVMLIIKPGVSGFQPAALIVVLIAAMMVARDTLSRIIGVAAPPFVVSFSTSLLGTIVGLLLTPVVRPFGITAWGPWLWPDLFSFAACCSAGIFLVAAHSFSFLAFRSGDMSAVAPFRYFYLFFAVIGGIIVFADYPDWVSLLGMVLIVAGGIYLLHRERLRAQSRIAAETTSAGP